MIKYKLVISNNTGRGADALNIIVVRADISRDFDGYCGKYLKYISDERRARTERMRSERDRITSVIAELTVRMQAAKCTGMRNDEIFFDYGEHGKPFLRGRDDFCFSFSHAGEYIAFACGSSPVGVDIENSSRGSEKLAKRFFTEEEYRSIYGDSERRESFVRVWTAKEAYVKYLGTGLSEGLDTFSVLDDSTGCVFDSFEVPGGYTVTLCAPAGVVSGSTEIITADEVFSFFDGI